MRSIACFALSTIVLCSGCMLNFTGVKGSGISATENRQVEDFSAISVSGVADVNVSVGGEKSVIVTIDDNLQELVKTEVANGRLSVYTKGNYSTQLGMDIQITVPTLEEVDVSGVGDLEVTGVAGPKMDVSLSGVGEVKMSGSVDELDVSVSGVGGAKLTELVAKNAKVSVSGVGGAQIHASESVNASASGVGGVKVYGNPTDVSKSVSGIGGIEIVK